jgi:hypothetical protein
MTIHLRTHSHASNLQTWNLYKCVISIDIHLQVMSITCNPKELSASWEAASHSATQDFLNILKNLMVPYHVRKGPPLGQVNPVHTTPC